MWVEESHAAEAKPSPSKPSQAAARAWQVLGDTTMGKTSGPILGRVQPTRLLHGFEVCLAGKFSTGRGEVEDLLRAAGAQLLPFAAALCGTFSECLLACFICQHTLTQINANSSWRTRVSSVL